MNQIEPKKKQLFDAEQKLKGVEEMLEIKKKTYYEILEGF